MKAAILQISEGSDIIGSIVEYATNNQVGVLIFSASGLVRDVTLSQPQLSLPGAFHMLSLTGTFDITGSDSAAGDFSVTLSGEQGQTFRGIVAGKLVAASDVLVAAALTSDKPVVYSVLPNGTAQEEEEEEEDEEEEEEEGLTDIE